MPQHISAIYTRLARESPSDSVSAFLQYVQRTWIDSTVWPPASWSVYQMSVRTNNDLEGWHNRLNSRGRPQMNLYMLVTLLHDESCLVPTQIRLVSEDKLRRYQRKSSRSLEARIQKLWRNYEEGDKSAQQLLRAASQLYGPRLNLSIFHVSFHLHIIFKCIYMCIMISVYDFVFISFVCISFLNAYI